MARRKGKRYGRKKKSMWGMAKGVLYTGAIALPAYQGYQQLGGGTDGAVGVVKAMCFVDPATNSFSLAHGAQMWTPVAALTAVDLITTKLGLQRRIGQNISRILG